MSYPYPVPAPPYSGSDEIVGFVINANMTISDILDKVREENAYRSEKGQVWSFWLYFISVVGLIFFTMIPCVMSVYVFPRLFLDWRRRRKGTATEVSGDHPPDIVVNKAIDLRWWSIYFAVPFTVVQWIVSVAGGLPGWTVLNFGFVLYVIFLCIVMCCKRETPAAGGEGDNSEPTQTSSKKKLHIPAAWTTLPEEMSTQQKGLILTGAIGTILCFILLIIIVYAYTVDAYLLMDRTVSLPIREYQPQTAAKGLQLMYSYPRFATNMRLAFYARLFTNYCGKTFTRSLSDSEKDTVLVDDWINLYNINMSLYTPSDYKKYDSVNDWFIRKLVRGARPVNTDPDVVVSPADSRVTTFHTLDDAKVWIKGDSFDLPTMLGINADVKSTSAFKNGLIQISRLAPQDYHRFHAPVSGYIEEIQQIYNTYWSVSSDAARSDNDAFYNTRHVIIVNAGDRIGKVAIVAIGATCVGSVVLQFENGADLKIGSRITKGEQIGYMQFGGSTVVVVYQAGKIRFDGDIVRNSRFEVETYMRANERVGQSTLSVLDTK